jgi:hypothetical protein
MVTTLPRDMPSHALLVIKPRDPDDGIAAELGRRRQRIATDPSGRLELHLGKSRLDHRGLRGSVCTFVRPD